MFAPTKSSPVPVFRLYLSIFKSQRYNEALMNPRKIIYNEIIKKRLCNVRLMSSEEEEYYLAKCPVDVLVIIPDSKDFSKFYNDMDKTYLHWIINNNIKTISFKQLIFTFHSQDSRFLLLSDQLTCAQDLFSTLLYQYKLHPRMVIIVKQQGINFTVIQRHLYKQINVRVYTKDGLVSKFVKTIENIAIFAEEPTKYIKKLRNLK